MTVDVDGPRFAWRETGEGEVVALFHGLGGSRISWGPQMDGLGDRWRVAAWDMPGYGASAPLPDSPYTFRALAAAAADWICELGVERAHIVGISMGAMIAQYLAVWHPERVQTLTLMSTSSRFGLDGTMPDAWRAARLAPLDAGLEPAEFSERVLRGIGGPQLSEPVLSDQMAAMARVSGVALRRSIDCLVTHDTTRLLSSIIQHTLVLVGEFDSETPPEYSQYLVENLPHARMVTIPHAGHLLNAEAPVQVNRQLVAHLAAHPIVDPQHAEAQ